MFNFLNMVCVISKLKNTHVLWYQEAVVVIYKDNPYWYFTRFSSWKLYQGHKRTIGICVCVFELI